MRPLRAPWSRALVPLSRALRVARMLALAQVVGVVAACGSSSTATRTPRDAGASPPNPDGPTTTTSPPPAAPATTPGGPGGGPGAPVGDDAPRKLSTTVETSAGPLTVHAVHHGTMYLQLGGKVVWVDPWRPALAQIMGGLAAAPKADAVLITDVHEDHLDEAALIQVKKGGAPVIGPRAVAEKLAGTKVLANGETTTIATPRGPIEVTATPMYNLQRGPSPGKLFHDKGRGNGYLLAFGGKRVLIAGDTECTPELKAMKDIDLALVPMNLPYTMPPEEAAACVAAFRPKVAVPYHHRGSDPAVFAEALEGSGVKVELLRFY